MATRPDDPIGEPMPAGIPPMPEAPPVIPDTDDDELDRDTAVQGDPDD